MALGIILDIDDLLFDALATTPGRHLVHQLDPLLMPSLPRVRGADAKSVTWWGLGLGLGVGVVGRGWSWELMEGTGWSACTSKVGK